jgi:hypothetical protein
LHFLQGPEVKTGAGAVRQPVEQRVRDIYKEVADDDCLKTFLARPLGYGDAVKAANAIDQGAFDDCTGDG